MNLYLPKLREGSAALLPCALTLLLIAAGCVNYQLQDIAKITPFFAAASVFYWRLYNPVRLNRFVVLFIGVFQDVLYGSVLGSTSLLLLAFSWLVNSQRELVLSQSFVVCWVFFSVAITLFALASWLLNSVLMVGYLVTDITVLYQLALSMICYPLLYRLFRLVDD